MMNQRALADLVHLMLPGTRHTMKRLCLEMDGKTFTFDDKGVVDEEGRRMEATSDFLTWRTRGGPLWWLEDIFTLKITSDKKATFMYDVDMLKIHHELKGIISL